MMIGRIGKWFSQVFREHARFCRNHPEQFLYDELLRDRF